MKTELRIWMSFKIFKDFIKGGILSWIFARFEKEYNELINRLLKVLFFSSFTMFLETFGFSEFEKIISRAIYLISVLFKWSSVWQEHSLWRSMQVLQCSWLWLISPNSKKAISCLSELQPEQKYCSSIKPLDPNKIIDEARIANMFLINFTLQNYGFFLNE